MDIRTLNNLSDLRQTGFGQPPPRHGLSLLWWFANECVQIDSNGHMTAQYNPAKRDFGFKRFYNREKILLYTSLKYYTVGNLRTCGSLPKYVTKNYTRQSKKSNTDRIIVSFDSGCNRFKKIYVTQHSDRVKFDQNHTYCISTELIKDIQDLSREDFFSGCTNHSEHISIDIPQSVQGETCQNISNELIQEIQDWSHEEFLREPTDHSLILQRVQHYQTNPSQSMKYCCALTCCSLLVLLLIIVAIFYSLSK